MTILLGSKHPIVVQALEMARVWCAGNVIDGAPALRHAVEVAAVIDQHVSDARPELVAACLLHDSPEFAPKTIDLDTTLTDQLGSDVARIVRRLEREHAAMVSSPKPDLDAEDVETLLASTADKIVSLSSMVRRAARAADPAEFWEERQPFIALLPYFRAFHAAATPHLPPSMSDVLFNLIDRAEVAVSTAQGRAAVPQEHTPLRPSWACGTCGVAWPCEPARTRLDDEYEDQRVNLSVYMATQLGHAAGDLPGDITPAQLYERFIAWTR